jgi:hypothetical protein
MAFQWLFLFSVEIVLWIESCFLSAGPPQLTRGFFDFPKQLGNAGSQSHGTVLAADFAGGNRNFDAGSLFWRNSVRNYGRFQILWRSSIANLTQPVERIVR